MSVPSCIMQRTDSPVVGWASQSPSRTCGHLRERTYVRIMETMKMPNRPSISPATERLVWARAAGRCTLCNRLVTENEDLGEVVPIGEMAHNVGWSEASPRGESELTPAERAESENLLLLCRNCHRPIDTNGCIDRYSTEELQRFKRDHEARIRMLTEVGGDRTAILIRVVGNIRVAQPELSRDTTLDALVRAGVFPELLPNAYFPEYELDLRGVAEPYGPEEFEYAARQLNALMVRIQDGVGQGIVTRLAVFGFARIPVLIYLGAQLDDKIDVLVFQRQRVDGENAWSWPADGAEVTFETTRLQEGLEDRVAVVVNLSGTIDLADIPAGQPESSTIYSISPSAPAIAGPSLVTSPATVAHFDKAMRGFLAMVELDHPSAESIDVYAAVPLSIAVTMGRALMPDVSPTLRVFDRGEDGQFFVALEVTR